MLTPQDDVGINVQNQFVEMPDTETWWILVRAVKAAAEKKGYRLERVPGRGRSNVWTVEKGTKEFRASIRTSKDRWIAFPPLDAGKKWKTLDNVDVVFVGVVDHKDNPRNIDVYELDADEVRQHFKLAYAARRAAGQTIPDNFGMWISLDLDRRGIPASVGSGLAGKHRPIATYSIDSLLKAHVATPSEDSEDASAPHPGPNSCATIGEVLASAREKISKLAGVDSTAVKLDLKIEY